MYVFLHKSQSEKILSLDKKLKKFIISSNFCYKFMKNFYLSLIFFTGVINFITFLLILFYVDPYTYKNVAYVSFVITFNISFACLLSLIVFFIKKIYYRGAVDYRNILASVRQSGFLSLFITWIVIFYIVKAPLVLSFLLLFMIFIFLEVIAQSR